MAKKKSTLEKHAGKVAKKIGAFSLFLIAALFIFGGVGGYLVANVMTKNDTFQLVGEKVVTLQQGQTYQDEGVLVISFGKKVSNEKVTVENNIDYDKAGQYYIKYSVDNIRYKGVYRYRTIVIEEVQTGE